MGRKRTSTVKIKSDRWVKAHGESEVYKYYLDRHTPRHEERGTVRIFRGRRTRRYQRRQTKLFSQKCELIATPPNRGYRPTYVTAYSLKKRKKIWSIYYYRNRPYFTTYILKGNKYEKLPYTLLELRDIDLTPIIKQQHQTLDQFIEADH